MQKNLCPFFFFEGLPVSPTSSSFSETAASSSESPISMSMSWRSFDRITRCVFPPPRPSVVDGKASVGLLLADGPDNVEAESGRGPSRPAPKLSRVGVLVEDSSRRMIWALSPMDKSLGRGREVVGATASCIRPRERLSNSLMELTAVKVDMRLMYVNGPLSQLSNVARTIRYYLPQTQPGVVVTVAKASTQRRRDKGRRLGTVQVMLVMSRNDVSAQGDNEGGEVCFGCRDQAGGGASQSAKVVDGTCTHLPCRYSIGEGGGIFSEGCNHRVMPACLTSSSVQIEMGLVARLDLNRKGKGRV